MTFHEHSAVHTWPWPRVLAHRGGGVLAPENTLAAIAYGHAHGFRGVEFDVMLAADDVPVLMHDPHFGRTVTGTGSVALTPSDQLARCDAGSWHSTAYAGEPVALLADVLEYCRRRGIWMNIEIKPSSAAVAYQTGQIVGALVRSAFAQELARGAQRCDPALPEFSSFSMDALAGARNTAQEIARGLLVEAVPSDWLAQLRSVDACALHARHKELDAHQVRLAHAQGFAVMCYTVNTPERVQELFAWGVDALCTDRLDLISPE